MLLVLVDLVLCDWSGRETMRRTDPERDCPRTGPESREEELLDLVIVFDLEGDVRVIGEDRDGVVILLVLGA